MRGPSKRPAKKQSSGSRRPVATAQAPRGERPHRPERDKARWVIGLHSCEETLRIRPKAVRELWLREGWESSAQLRALEETARAARIPVKTKAVGQLETFGSGHQGAALACLETPEVDWDKLQSAEAARILILDGIEDPHNLGSIIRTAWLMGVDAIFTPADRAVGLTPTVCKVASGGAEHVPVESAANLASVMEDLKTHDFWIYGLAEAGKSRPWDLKLGKKTAWVIGAEAGGMRKPVERACDELVRLPQVESGSSFNAAIACAMALAETCRQSGTP